MNLYRINYNRSGAQIFTEYSTHDAQYNVSLLEIM